MTALAQHSAATFEWGSPHDVVAMARHVLGRIECDPCTSEYWNNHVVKADAIYTEADSSLGRRRRHWTSDGVPVWRTFYINPPGGLVHEFFRFATERWLEGSAVFWTGFSLEQVVYLQRMGFFFHGFRRVVPPRRLAFMRGVADRPQRSLFGEMPMDAPFQVDDPTHGNYLLLMPSEQEQIERFEGACALMPGEVF